VTNDEEALLATRILIWLSQTETGDRAELRLSQGEEAVWRRLSADGAGCTSDNSPYVVEGSCFLQKARRAAEASHIVVVNHALLLSDKATGGRVLPPYSRPSWMRRTISRVRQRAVWLRIGRACDGGDIDRWEDRGACTDWAAKPAVGAGTALELTGVSQELRRSAATREPVRDCFGALSAHA
jgi:hypothetical protein